MDGNVPVSTMNNWAVLLIVNLLFYPVFGVELTFELYDNAKDCFFENIEKDTTATIEYQVSFYNRSRI